MRKEIYEHSRNYTATVVAISNLRPVEGLDNLVATRFFGNDILVGKDTKAGQIGLYFAPETQVSNMFLSANNLYRHSQLNADPAQTGFFEDNGRVKAIRLRGNTSSGFFIPISSLSALGLPTAVQVGDEFNVLDGVEICKKFIRKYPKGNNVTPKQAKFVHAVDTRCFTEHIHTDQLMRNVKRFQLDDIISITIKLHGTSGRTGLQPVYREFTWKDRVAEWFGVPVQIYTYEYITGSRKVIKNILGREIPEKFGFYDTDIWTQAGQKFHGLLHKGETVYYEIIGWAGTSPIQPKYTYSLPVGSYKVFVYRITRSNEDGVLEDLPWDSVKQRCKELQVDHVPELFHGLMSHANIFGITPENLQNSLDKPSRFSTADWEEVEEGFVVTRYKLGVNEAYKLKSQLFLQHETKQLDADAADIEEEQQ